MRMIAVPRRSRMSRIRSRIPAWIVTSSAVVGSSAISTFGLQATAIAIITRWRMPPESWCGYSSTRRAGAGIPTSSSSSIVRSRASARSSPRWWRSTSPICRPTVKTGFSDVIGSWNTNEISRPRTLRRVASSADSRSRPSKRAVPDSCAEAGSSRSSDIAVTLLPQPDSPTTASTSPGSSENDTRSTACTEPSSVSKRTESSSTSSSAISASSSGRGRRAARRRAG